MPEITYRSLVWLSYRLTATFAIGLPFVLLIWAAVRKEASMTRLLIIYWKIASLIGISTLLVTDRHEIGYLTAFISPLLMFASIWFWIDLNDELADLPPWRALPLTVRIWRWTLTSVCLFTNGIMFIALPCSKDLAGVTCTSWLEAPKGLHGIAKELFQFLFGGEWTEPLAGFLGYLGLIIYLVSILQWLLIRFPRQGRIAGDF